VPADGEAAVVLWDLQATGATRAACRARCGSGWCAWLDQRAVASLVHFRDRLLARHAGRRRPRCARPRKDGAVVEAGDRGERDLSEPWYGLYYDVRAKTVEFPDLHPGDTIGAGVRRRGPLADQHAGRLLRRVEFLREEFPRRAAEVVVAMPPGKALVVSAPELKGLTHTVERHPRRRRGPPLRRARRAAPGRRAGHAGLVEVAAPLHVSTYRSWTDVAAWYRALIADQLVPDDAIRRARRPMPRGD